MKNSPFAAALALLLCACPVEHAGSRLPGHDSGSSTGDGGSDAAPVDTAGIDLAGVDAWRPDVTGQDAWRPDVAQPDAARPDAAAACLVDDAYEPNNSAAEAVSVTAPGTIEGLIGCDDDWYAFTLPAGRSVTVTILFVDDQADLDLYLHNAADPQNHLDSSISTSDNETVSFAGYAEATAMLVRVKHFSGGEAPYTLVIDFPQPPDNDTCTQAQVLQLSSGGQVVSASGDTSLATDTYNSGLEGCQDRYSGDIARELFYRFTTSAGMDGTVLVDLFSNGWNGVVYAFEGGCSAAQEITCGQSSIAIPVQPSTTYHVVVDALDYDAGSFTLELHYAPPASNDTCEGAQVVSVPASGAPVVVSANTVTGTNTRSASDSSEWCQAVARYAPELFYRINTSSSGGGVIQVALDSPGWEAALYGFADSCGASDELACMGEYYREDPLWFRYPVAASSTYYLVVDGYGDICCDAAAGPFTLSLNYYLPEPTLEGGETCDAAVALAGSSGGVHGSTAIGSDELGPEDVGCSGWASGYDKFYRLAVDAGLSAHLTLTHGDPSSGAVLYVLRDECPVRADSCIDAVSFDQAPQGELRFQNTSGAAATYLVVVDAEYYYHGEDYDLYWEIY